MAKKNRRNGSRPQCKIDVKFQHTDCGLSVVPFQIVKISHNTFSENTPIVTSPYGISIHNARNNRSLGSIEKQLEGGSHNSWSGIPSTNLNGLLIDQIPHFKKLTQHANIMITCVDTISNGIKIQTKEWSHETFRQTVNLVVHHNHPVFIRIKNLLRVTVCFHLCNFHSIKVTLTQQLPNKHPNVLVIRKLGHRLCTQCRKDCTQIVTNTGTVSENVQSIKIT